MNNNNNKQEEVKNICPICKSENTIKWTKRKTQNRGLIQRYKCKDCDKTFVMRNNFLDYNVKGQGSIQFKVIVIFIY